MGRFGFSIPFLFIKTKGGIERTEVRKNMVRRAQRKEVNIVPAVGSTSLNPFDALSGLYEEYEYDLNLFSSFRLYTAITRLDDPNYDREKVKEAIYNQYKEASIKLVSTSHPVVIKIACEKEEDMLKICKNGLLIRW